MKIVIFDLDGTLAESKSKIEPEMAAALRKLLTKFKVAIISGGAWPQFEKQVINELYLNKEEASNLYLLPTSGTSFYKFSNDSWEKVYSEELTQEEILKIESAFEKVIPSLNLSEESWGPRLENRGTQVTFSALGQLAPVEEKKNWDPDFEKRLLAVNQLIQLLPEFEVRTGGSTSIDVTKKGIDKAYGIKKIEEVLNLKKSDMFFVGDALFPGGNDNAVLESGVECVETSGPDTTLYIINSINQY